MSFYLGIDQGRTKTNAVIIAADGRLLALGKAPGAYYLLDGMAVQMQAIAMAVQDAHRKAGQAVGIDGLYAGLIGADWPDEHELLAREVGQLRLSPQNVVVNDSFIALRGGTKQPSGVILVAGTGGNCAIVSPSGDRFLYHFYQEAELQGGSALGRAALDAIYKAETGRIAETCLRQALLQFTGLPDVDALLRSDVERRLPVDISQFAPLVFQAARLGDGAALAILVRFAVGLAGLVSAGLKRYRMTDLKVEIVLSGSIFKSDLAFFTDTLRKEIHRVAPRAVLVQARYEPVVGAAILALENWGIEITAEVQKNIEETSQALGLIRLPGSAA